jgi:glycosyltransferase involved in cell wall biosynthesis
MESAAHGTPTVAFRSAGGPRESIVHEGTGLLVDDEAGFVDAVRGLLADDALRGRLGSAARVRAARFSWDVAIDAFEAEILAVAGVTSPRSPALGEPHDEPHGESGEEPAEAIDAAG